MPVSREAHLALVVSPNDDDHWNLIHILQPAGWSVDRARTCAEAIQALEIARARVVITEVNLPDGNWKTLLSRLTRLAAPPRMVVTSRMANERLWSEVLSMGGFDVLAQPFWAGEVLRSVNSASRHWQEEWGNAEPQVEEADRCMTA
jgi:DNA-binding NtrC family response regulator